MSFITQNLNSPAVILQPKNKTDNFKSYAIKILPDNFTIKCEKDAYELWMPNTAKSEKMLGMYSI